MMRKVLAIVIVAFLVPSLCMTCVSTGKIPNPDVDNPSNSVAKPSNKNPDKDKVESPFTPSEASAQGMSYRVESYGTSPDIAMAQNIAMDHATAKIAELAQNLANTVLQVYYNSGDEGNGSKVVRQTVRNTRVVDEKCTKDSDGIYTYWVAVETDKGNIRKMALSSIGKKIDLNDENNLNRVNKILDDVMNKIAE